MSSQSKTGSIIHAGEGRKLNVLGHDFSVKLDSAETHGDSYVFEITTPPGYFVPVHAQEHEDEYGYIIEGLFEVFMDGRSYEAETGALLHFPRCVAHGFRNIGSTPGKMIWLSTPGAKVERFFDEMAALPAGGPPDMEKMAGIFAKYDTELLPTPGV